MVADSSRTSARTSARTIVHVAQLEISRESGMGRVAWHWRQELEARGYAFVHIGTREVGRPVHPALFPYAAWRRFRRLGVRPAAFLVHEPAGAPFVVSGAPAFVFSHGLERRGWEAALAQATAFGPPIRARSRLLFPLWRLRQADFALRRARAVLVLNREDLAYTLERYRRRPEDIHLFRNGVYPVQSERAEAVPPTLLFVGTWMLRKGVRTLVEAVGILKQQGIAPHVLLAGTGADEPAVLAEWPEELRPAVSVIPRFTGAEELSLYPRADLFVLPSFFEGQPLALLQAMAAGCCCIASDIGGHRDLIRHCENGLLYPPGDAGGLAATIAECLASPVLRRTLGRNAQLAVAGRTWESAARDVAGFLEGVLGGSPA